MSISAKKKNVFEEIAVLKTASELSLNKKNILSAFESSKIKNNKDPFLFMVDLLFILAGSDSVNNVITETFLSIDKIEASFKTKLKDELLSQNGGKISASPIPEKLRSGVKIHINKLDFNKELFTKDDSKDFDLYLDSSKKELINLIKVPNKEVVLYKVLKATYDNSTGYFTIKPVDNNISFKSFVYELIDNIDFIDPKVLFNLTLDKMFNTRKRNKEQIIIEEQIDKSLNKLLVQETEDDSFFEFNTEDLKEIEFKLVSQDKLYTEIGCGRVGLELTSLNIQAISSGITFPVSKKIISNTIKNTTEVLFKSDGNGSIKENDKQSIRNNFLNKFMITLKNNLIRGFVASPQLNLIHTISQAFSEDIDTTFDPLDDIKKRKGLIKCVMKEIINALLTKIYKLLKKEILILVNAVALIYATEAIDKYRKILMSLIKIKK